MKHYIIVKYKDEVSEADRSRIAGEAEALFKDLVGKYDIRGVDVYKNCTPRPNRYDLMICVDMPASSLALYDESSEHKEWKADYGRYIANKAIFDCE